MFSIFSFSDLIDQKEIIMIPTKLLTSFFFSLSLSRHAQLDKGLTLSPYRGFMAIKQVILIKTSFLLYLDVLHKLFFFFYYVWFEKTFRYNHIMLMISLFCLAIPYQMFYHSFLAFIDRFSWEFLILWTKKSFLVSFLGVATTIVLSLPLSLFPILQFSHIP